jgi:hypothetical protein
MCVIWGKKGNILFDKVTPTVTFLEFLVDMVSGKRNMVRSDP